MLTNHQQIKDDATLPGTVIDAKRGIIKLNPGEYAVMLMQFRVGDGDDVWKELKALAISEALLVPIAAPWKPPTADPRAAAIELDNALLASFAIGSLPAVAIRAEIDRQAVMMYYLDYVLHGERAFLESHYGRDDADAYERITKDGGEMGLEMMKRMAESPEGRQAFLSGLAEQGYGKTSPDALQDFFEGLSQGRHLDGPMFDFS